MGALKAHPFFQGIDWPRVRQMQPPAYVPPRQPDATAMALDWELTSLVNASAGPVKVEYLQQGTAV
jgi:hypothetical protein